MKFKRYSCKTCRFILLHTAPCAKVQQFRVKNQFSKGSTKDIVPHGDLVGAFFQQP